MKQINHKTLKSCGYLGIVFEVFKLCGNIPMRGYSVGRKIKKDDSSSQGIIPPAKHSEIQKKVKTFIANEKYVATGHAKQRLDQRDVSMKEVRSALLSGKRVSSEDKYHTHDDSGKEINRWSYAFTKKGFDRPIKVCVSISETESKPLLIVTVIDLS